MSAEVPLGARCHVPSILDGKTPGDGTGRSHLEARHVLLVRVEVSGWPFWVAPLLPDAPLLARAEPRAVSVEPGARGACLWDDWQDPGTATRSMASGQGPGQRPPRRPGRPRRRVGSGPRPRGPRGQPCGRGAAGGGERAPNCPDLQTWPAPRRPHKSAATVSAVSAARLGSSPSCGEHCRSNFPCAATGGAGHARVGWGREGGGAWGEGTDGQGPTTLQMPVSGASSPGSPLPNGPESPLAV